VVFKLFIAGAFYKFTPLRDQTIDVEVYPERFSSRDILNFYANDNICFITDPGKTKDNCGPPDDFDPKTIISPDEGHWGGSEFIKQRDYSSERISVFSCLGTEGIIERAIDSWKSFI
jgi:hypothetical protein